MLNVLGARLQQKKRTIAFPKSEPVCLTFPRPTAHSEIALRFGLSESCADVCPTDAIRCTPDEAAIDLASVSSAVHVLGVSAQGDPPHRRLSPGCS